MKLTNRPQWPHTIEDIVRSLDGIWGVVGANGVDGNLIRLERSLAQPAIYTLTEYEGQDETKVLSKETYQPEEKSLALSLFASKLGFSDN